MSEFVTRSNVKDYTFTPNQAARKYAATPGQILNFCNKVRKAGNVDILEALLPGITGSQRSCLIAANLNFDCYVTPFGFKKDRNILEWLKTDPTPKDSVLTAYDYETSLTRWVMVVEDKKLQDKIAVNVGLPIVEHFYTSLNYKKSKVEIKSTTAILLPLGIGASAQAFDRGFYEKSLYQRNYGGILTA